MGEFGIAVLAAAAAVAGGVITGWFTHRAAERQADAARHAGDRQADAMLESVRIQAEATLDAVRLQLDSDRAERARAQRRRIYEQFVDAVDAWASGATAGGGGGADRAQAERAFGTLLFEGPDEVADRARDMLLMLRAGHADPTRLEQARSEFIAAARHAVASAA